MTVSLPILVAGAGPSGLAAALALLQNNIPVRIIEKESQYNIGQRGSGLCPRTFDVYHFLRVPEIHQRASPTLPVREYKPGTVEPTNTLKRTHKDPTPSIPYNNAKFLDQTIQESILRSHLEKYGCSVERGIELQSFEDDGERVLAKLVKRKDGQEVIETFEASYLIGADGAKGITRKRLGLTFLGETRPDFASVVGDICAEIKGVDRNHWHFFGCRTASFCMLRPTDDIGPDGFRMLMPVRDYDPKELIADKNLLCKHLSELIGHEVNIRKVVVLSEYRPNIRMVDKFGLGRVFVAGDAAHVHSPAGGQGLNNSVQDALNLAWKLSLVYKGLSPATLLDSYTTERLPVIAEMLEITTGLLDNIRGEPTIDRAMKREDRLNMLGVNYRTSPIVLDEFTSPEPVSAYRALDEGELVAGDRAPNAPVAVTGGAETGLFDVFSPTYHTVLMFAPDATATTGLFEVSRKYPADVIRLVTVLPEGSEVGTAAGQVDVVIDNGGHAHRAYLVVEGEQKVIVVRPDGVVGAVAHGAEGVGAYFAKIFI